MIEDERISAYISSLDQPESPLLADIRKQAIADGVPIIRSETAGLLRFLMHLKQPKNILEIGTAVGYSALVMSECGGSDCHIKTIEKYEKRIPIARANFEAAGEMGDRITLVCEDATEALAKDEGQYDLIFMDAAKGQYIVWLPDVLRLLAPGGLLISDNVLQDGDVLMSRFAVTRRNRTIHSRMREYLYTLTHTEGLDSVIIPIGDGVALTTGKKEETHEEG